MAVIAFCRNITVHETSKKHYKFLKLRRRKRKCRRNKGIVKGVTVSFPLYVWKTSGKQAKFKNQDKYIIVLNYKQNLKYRFCENYILSI